LLFLLCTMVMGARPQGWPDKQQVRALKPFVPDTNFMSVNGYLRHRYHSEFGRWFLNDHCEPWNSWNDGGYTGAAPTGG
jgi:hypothetical protein